MCGAHDVQRERGLLLAVDEGDEHRSKEQQHERPVAHHAPVASARVERRPSGSAVHARIPNTTEVAASDQNTHTMWCSARNPANAAPEANPTCPKNRTKA